MRRSQATLAIMTMLFALVLTGAARPRAEAEPLPPIGKRTYVIDGAASAPITIKPDGTKAKVFLKDPVHPANPRKLAPIHRPKVKSTTTVARPPEVRTGRLQFGKVSVYGHLRQPRVEFSRERLAIDRADELNPPDFLQKVYEPATLWP